MKNLLNKKSRTLHMPSVIDIVSSFLNDINVEEGAIKTITLSGSHPNNIYADVLIDEKIVQKVYEYITATDLNVLGHSVLHNIKTPTNMQVTAKLHFDSQVNPTLWPGGSPAPDAPPTSLTGPPGKPDIDESTLGNGAMMHGAACPKCGQKSEVTATNASRITCGKCGHIFSPKALTLNTAPSTEQYGTPYESDVPVTAQAAPQALQDPMDDHSEILKKQLEQMGITDTTITTVVDLIKNNKQPDQQNTQQVNENTTKSDTQQPMNTMIPIKQISSKQLHTLAELIDDADLYAEYKADQTDLFGTLLAEMSDIDAGEYRIQWYNTGAPLGHTTYTTIDAALKDLFIELGPGIHRVDGAIDSFAISDEWINHMKNAGINLLEKISWFDEPVGVNPGDGPYPPAVSFAEAKKEKKKIDNDSEKKPNKDESEIMEVITVLDTDDIIPFINDDALLDDLLAELLEAFPILGRMDIDVDALIRNAQVNKSPATDGDPSFGQFTPSDDSTENIEEVEHTDEDALDIPEETEESENEDDDLSIDDAIFLGEEIGIDWDSCAFTPDQFVIGIEVEFEHGTVDPDTDITGDNILETAKIAWAHLKEIPDYYTRLLKMEDAADDASTGDVQDNTDDFDDSVDSDDSDDSNLDADTSSADSSTVKNFDEGFPMSGAAYMRNCPNCDTVQSVAFRGPPTKCPNCAYPIPSMEDVDPDRLEGIEREQQQEQDRVKKIYDKGRGVPLNEFDDLTNEATNKISQDQSNYKPYMINPKEKNEINRLLESAGMDGNGRFPKATNAYGVIGDILDQFNLFITSFDDTGPLNQRSGKTTFQIERKLDDYDKTDKAIYIDNSMLSFDWYYFDVDDDGVSHLTNAEVVAYLS